MGKILSDISDYYTGKLDEFGATPKGVDWNDKDQQVLRFDKLLQVAEGHGSYSLLDFGCGYGATFEMLRNQGVNVDYTGVDISESMISKAKELYGDSAQWITKIPEGQSWDFTIASGIFNVKMQHNDEDWKAHMLQSLDQMNTVSDKGFSFNVLTSYSDVEYQREDLYYADPLYWFDHCKKNYSKYVSLIHDYELYEFTMIVKKEGK